MVAHGTTSGGGTIYTVAVDAVPGVILYVRDGDQLWQYALVGGP